MESHRQYWQEEEVVQRFADKAPHDFFKSETRFIAQIGAELQSVFDIGCASGRFVELLEQYAPDISYTGVDFSAVSIENARRLYPQHTFFHADALTFTPSGTFDLVNATGVCQHEPNFESLIRRMIDWSKRYVLVDVKLALLDDHLIDINTAYCRHDPPIHFIALSLPRLKAYLATQESVARITIFGYVTPTNSVTVVPATLGDVVSAGILLEKKERPGGDGPLFELALPDFLLGSA